MGTFKKEKNRRNRDGETSGGLANVRTKGENFYRYVWRRTPPSTGLS